VIALPVCAGSSSLYTTDGYSDTLALPSWTMWIVILASLVLFALPAAMRRRFRGGAHREDDNRAKVAAVITLVLILTLPVLFLMFLFVAPGNISE
jgi:uncharacterized membrane protein